MRRRLLLNILAAAVALPLLYQLPAQAQNAPGQNAATGAVSFFRIGTGGAAGTYFPIGDLIARSASDVPAGPRCEPAAPASRCGIPGLIAVAQVSNGSVANVEALQQGNVEGALVQSDIAYWAYNGEAVFAGKPKYERLRFVANLYPEALHAVVRRAAGIKSIEDLKGHPVSLDEPGSGTLVTVRALLAAHGLAESGLRPEYVKPEIAMARLSAGSLDAFFILAGSPTKAVQEAANTGLIDLLPVRGAAATRLIERNPFLARGSIPAGSYTGISETETVTVGAQFLVRADLPDTLVTGLLENMWNSRGRALFAEGHPRGREIQLERALQGRGIPLHPGAAAFYRARGMAVDK